MDVNATKKIINESIETGNYKIAEKYCNELFSKKLADKDCYEYYLHIILLYGIDKSYRRYKYSLKLVNYLREQLEKNNIFGWRIKKCC